MRPHFTPLSLSTTVACTLAIGVLGLSARADTITVCLDGSCDFTDPAAAVQAATAGDTIEIAAGTYPLTSPISFEMKDVVVRGAVDAAGRPATVLDGQGIRQLAILLFATGATEIENLVFANGRADSGGALFLHSSSPTFRNCRLSGNAARFQGGAMFLAFSSNPTMIGCTFSNNAARDVQFPGQGVAGAVMISSGRLTLIDSEITGNITDNSGGGIYMSSRGILALQSSRVCGNTSPSLPQVGQNPGGQVVDLGGGCILNDCNACPTACLADFNRDGGVDGADVESFFAAWTTGDSRGDVNQDGGVDGSDIEFFFIRWVDGC